jgi:molybdenum cofactor guanylyltransferase
VTEPWTAIILTGGTSTRLGTDKSQVLLGGRTILQRIVTALDVPVIVVGPDGQGLPVRVVREEPIGSGPAAGLAAALPQVTTDIVGVLATDMPFAVPVLYDVVSRISETADGCIAVDDQGRDQYLCAAYRSQALRGALSGDPAGSSMREVIASLAIERFAVTDPARLLDIDTPEDLLQAQIMEANDASVD